MPARNHFPLHPVASGLVLFLLAGPGRAETLADLWNASRGGMYQAPEQQDLAQAEMLFERTLAGKEDLDNLKKAWLPLKFELLSVTEEGKEFLVLREPAASQTGRGFYVFRRGPTPAIVLQAPHRADDLHTGKIALSLFVEGQATACAWNSVPRSAGDLSHLETSYFQAFTRAFARQQPRSIIVQMHGFERDKRKTTTAMTADMILSNGDQTPPPWLLKLAKDLKENMDGIIKVYPNEVKELGGTTNCQSELLAGLTHDGFLHVEMSLPLRLRLKDDVKTREIFLKALMAAYRQERENPPVKVPAAKE